MSLLEPAYQRGKRDLPYGRALIIYSDDDIVDNAKISLIPVTKMKN